MNSSLSPYNSDSINLIYNLLFCDNINLYKTKDTDTSKYPWNSLFSDKFNQEGLVQIVEDEDLDTRLKILAGNRLLASGLVSEEKVLLGVIIEVALDEGLDVVAAYADGTARYINYSEKLIVWDSPTEQSNALVDDIFAASENVITKIGPWDKDRLPFPTKGMVRLTFLVSDGLYFGQGEFDVLFNDSMGGPVIEAAMQMMQFLTER